MCAWDAASPAATNAEKPWGSQGNLADSWGPAASLSSDALLHDADLLEEDDSVDNWHEPQHEGESSTSVSRASDPQYREYDWECVFCLE